MTSQIRLEYLMPTDIFWCLCCSQSWWKISLHWLHERHFTYLTLNFSKVAEEANVYITNNTSYLLHEENVNLTPLNS